MVLVPRSDDNNTTKVIMPLNQYNNELKTETNVIDPKKVVENDNACYYDNQPEPHDDGDLSNMVNRLRGIYVTFGVQKLSSMLHYRTQTQKFKYFIKWKSLQDSCLIRRLRCEVLKLHQENSNLPTTNSTIMGTSSELSSGISYWTSAYYHDFHQLFSDLASPNVTLDNYQASGNAINMENWVPFVTNIKETTGFIRITEKQATSIFANEATKLHGTLDFAAFIEALVKIGSTAFRQLRNQFSNDQRFILLIVALASASPLFSDIYSKLSSTLQTDLLLIPNTKENQLQFVIDTVLGVDKVRILHTVFKSYSKYGGLSYIKFLGLCQQHNLLRGKLSTSSAHNVYQKHVSIPGTMDFKSFNASLISFTIEFKSLKRDFVTGKELLQFCHKLFI